MKNKIIIALAISALVLSGCAKQEKDSKPTSTEAASSSAFDWAEEIKEVSTKVNKYNELNDAQKTELHKEMDRIKKAFDNKEVPEIILQAHYTEVSSWTHIISMQQSKK